MVEPLKFYCMTGTSQKSNKVCVTSISLSKSRDEFLGPHFYPIALRKTKIIYNFGLSECNRVNLVTFRQNDATGTMLVAWNTEKNIIKKNISFPSSQGFPAYLLYKNI